MWGGPFVAIDTLRGQNRLAFQFGALILVVSLTKVFLDLLQGVP
jgi:hypothetical protein